MAREAARKAEKCVKKAKRMSYEPAFKLMVVKAALQRPANNRIKPTCANFPGIEPCQVKLALPELTPSMSVEHALTPRGGACSGQTGPDGLYEETRVHIARVTTSSQTDLRSMCLNAVPLPDL